MEIERPRSVGVVGGLIFSCAFHDLTFSTRQRAHNGDVSDLGGKGHVERGAGRTS
jgi:hypothetical protein